MKAGYSVKNWFLWILGFCLPIAILLAVSASTNVYPFGNNSFLTEDLKYQYIDFYTWFQSVLVGEGGIFYSGAQSLGSNTWGLYSYYLASPFNFLVVFFDQSHLTDFVYLITALKLGCIQLAIMVYLRKRFNLSLGLALILGICFTWSSWTASQLRNPIWLDMLILLPLLCLGGYRFIHNMKHFKLLLVSLVLSVIVCWYTAYLSFVFLGFYLVFEYYVAYLGDPAFNRARLIKTIVRFVVLLIVAFLLTAWTFVPTVLAMVGDKSGSVIGVEPTSLFSLITSHALLVIAMVFAVALVICGAVFLLKTKRISPRIKVLIGVVAFFACLVGASFINRYLWHHFLAVDFRSILFGFFFGTWHLGTAQFFSSALVTILVIIFAFNKKYSLRLRVAAFVLLAFLVVSAWITPLYCFWCGFRWPNGFFCRMSLFAIFVMVWMAAYCFSRHQQSRALSLAATSSNSVALTTIATSTMTKTFSTATVASATTISAETVSTIATRWIVVAAVFLLLAACGAYWLGRFSDTRVFVASIGFILVIGTCLFLYFREPVYKTVNEAAYGSVQVFDQQREPAGHTILKIVLGVVISLELVCSGALIWSQLYVGYDQDHHDEYVADSRAQWQAIEETDPGYYRFNKTYTRTLLSSRNEGLAIGYDELGSYSSAHNGNAVKLLNELGYSREGEFSVSYIVPIFTSDALLGSKYVASLTKPLGYIATDLPTASNGAEVYENPYVLPLGYGVNEAVQKASFEGTTNPFERQNILISALLGREVAIFKPCSANITATTQDKYGDMASTTYQVTVPENKATFAYVATHSAVECSLEIDGGAAIPENTRWEQNVQTLVGFTHPEQFMSVKLTKTPGFEEVGQEELRANPDIHAMDCVFYYLDETAFQNAIDELAAHPLELETYDDGFIKATFNARSGEATSQLAMLTIPCDAGWSVSINGEVVQPISILDGALMGLPVNEGINTIEMHYISPGFVPGCIISLVTMIAFIAVALVARRNVHRKARG